jgi:hypothetical protein
MCDFKKWFLKTQLSVWQNHSLTFKISNLPLKFCGLKKKPSYLRFEKVDFFFFAFSNRNFLKRGFQTIYILRFGLKSHLLSTKSQSQAYP